MVKPFATLALGAAAAAAGCVPPSVNSNVMSMDCATAGASLAVTFTKTNVYTGLGYIALTGSSGLCFAANGVVPDDGFPAIGLAPCDKTGATPAQLFAQLLDGTVLSGLTGQCLDLESGVKAPNERLELYSCSGNANQASATLRHPAAAGCGELSSLNTRARAGRGRALQPAQHTPGGRSTQSHTTRACGAHPRVTRPAPASPACRCSTSPLRETLSTPSGAIALEPAIEPHLLASN